MAYEQIWPWIADENFRSGPVYLVCLDLFSDKSKYGVLNERLGQLRAKDVIPHVHAVRTKLSAKVVADILVPHLQVIDKLAVFELPADLFVHGGVIHPKTAFQD